MKTKHRWYIIAAAVLLAAAAAVGILGYFRYGSLVPGAGSGNNAGRELVLEQNYAYARRAQQAGDYETARRMFSELGDYKDAAAKCTEAEHFLRAAQKKRAAKKCRRVLLVAGLNCCAF